MTGGNARPKRKLRPAARTAFACVTAAGLASTAWHANLVYRNMGPASEFVIDEARSRAELFAASRTAITEDYANRRITQLVGDCDLATAESYVAVAEAQELSLSADTWQAYDDANGVGARALCLG
ncbi:MAG TPA: hypothetical protein VK862_06905, partial [Afifellaceae bacterium]|nr:hypothetical protein [Afifellaceae bacterium]